jgi:hypothetical protein
VLDAVKRRALMLAAIASVSATVGVCEDDRLSRAKQRAAIADRYYILETRARQLVPRRRDNPMRVNNITDEEVREIQAAALDIVPRSLINIGAVTTGCACEDGPSCTDQVWIVAADQSRTTGLLLSRILGVWVVGPVQAWWLRYEEFLRDQRRYSKYYVDEVAQRKLLDQMPFCATGTERRRSDGSTAAPTR